MIWIQNSSKYNLTIIFYLLMWRAVGYRFVTIGFRSLYRNFRKTYKRGGGGRVSSVETTRLARTETRHDFLAHGDLLRVSLYGRQGRDSVWVHNRLLCAERSNTQHARVKTKTVIIKAVQDTCLRTNWCEVLLLHKSQYLNKDTKERKKSLWS